MATATHPASLPPGFRAGFRRALEFRREPLRVLPQLAATYGDVARMTFRKQHAVLLSDPELVRQVLVTDGWNFVKTSAITRTKRLLGEGLLTSEGEVHRRQRRLMQPAFHHERLRGYAESMAAYSTETADAWQSGQTVDIHAEMMRLTLRIVARTLFGGDVARESATVSDSLTEIMENFNVLAGPLEELMERLPTPAVRRFEGARDRLDEVVYRLIATRRERTAGAESEDLLAMLVGSSDEDGSGGRMSDQLLRDEVMTVFLAGHETTANALTYAWWLLAQHPEVQAQLDAELAAVLDGRAPSLEDVPRLTYTRQVFAEAMRLYPPAWIMGRTVVTPQRLGGYDLPAGAIVLMSQWVMHRDPRWFAEPERFDPSRWTPDAIASRPKFSYFPFGAGTRICIGEQFAWMEGVLVLATLAQRWRLTLPADAPRKLDLFPGITLRPRGAVRMQVDAREHNA